MLSITNVPQFKITSDLYDHTHGFLFKIPAGNIVKIVLNKTVLFKFDKQEQRVRGVLKLKLKTGKYNYKIIVADNKGLKSVHTEKINIRKSY